MLAIAVDQSKLMLADTPQSRACSLLQLNVCHAKNRLFTKDPL